MAAMTTQNCDRGSSEFLADFCRNFLTMFCDNFWSTVTRNLDGFIQIFGLLLSKFSNENTASIWRYLAGILANFGAIFWPAVMRNIGRGSTKVDL